LVAERNQRLELRGGVTALATPSEEFWTSFSMMDLFLVPKGEMSIYTPWSQQKE
jgi:hypothetical protein